MAPTPKAIVMMDNGFETRYFRSAKRGAQGIQGWGFRNSPHSGDSRLSVYRLDEDASADLQREAQPHLPDLANTNPVKPPPVSRLVAVLERWF